MDRNYFYEQINRAALDTPHMEALHNLQYCAHYHEELELITVTEGTIVLTVDGQITELCAGDIAIVEPFRIHSLNTPEHSLIYLFKILSHRFDFAAVHREQYVLRPQESENPPVQACIYELLAEIALPEEDPLRQLALRAATDRLLVMLARLPGVTPCDRQITAHADRDMELFRTVNEYLEGHYQEPVSLESIAAVCHISMYYFAHSFKKTTGTTFLNYLTEFRLQKARRRMIETDESITAIAMHCGFASIRTFNRCFLNHFKITPTEARQQWKRVENSIRLK